MQTKKFREITLLTLPVLAIAALAPGAHWLDNWRAARAVPRVNAFALRPVTAWEASQGATVGYTANTVVPDNGGPFWSGNIEVRGARGESFASDTPAWNLAGVPNDDHYPGDSVASDDIGSADNTSGGTMKLRGGLKWKRIAGSRANVWAKVSLWSDDAAPTRHVEKAREFKLHNDIALPPLRVLRRANFKLEKVQMITSDGEKFGLSHQIIFLIRRLGPSPKPAPDFVSFDLWNLWKLNSNRGKPNFSPRFDSRSDGQRSQELTAVNMDFAESAPLLRGTPAHLNGPLFISDGWPQNVRVELPQGLPGNLGTVELPFSAQLAPLPK